MFCSSKSSTKETHCCIFLAALNMYTFLTAIRNQHVSANNAIFRLYHSALVLLKYSARIKDEIVFTIETL